MSAYLPSLRRGERIETKEPRSNDPSSANLPSLRRGERIETSDDKAAKTTSSDLPSLRRGERIAHRTTPSRGDWGGAFATRIPRWCRAAIHSQTDLSDRAPDAFNAKIQAAQGRLGQQIVQARRVTPRTKAFKLGRRNDDHCILAANRHTLRLTGGSEADDIAELRFGLPPASNRAAVSNLTARRDGTYPCSSPFP